MPDPEDISAEGPPRLTFRPRHRLRHDREFQAVFGARVKKSGGPLTVFTRVNDLPHHRLGLSIGRRVGPAVRRNLLKRHLREAFRTVLPTLPLAGDRRTLASGLDIVVAAHAHEPLDLDEYRRLFVSLVGQSLRVWEKRARRDAEAADV